jgi:hypothetical protein
LERLKLHVFPFPLHFSGFQAGMTNYQGNGGRFSLSVAACRQTAANFPADFQMGNSQKIFSFSASDGET